MLCITMHTGIFASTPSERMAILKNKAAQRQANIDGLQQSITDAERQLTRARSEESRLKDNLADTIESADSSADSMQNQLQTTLQITLEQTEQHARQNAEKQSYIKQFDTLRLRYEGLFKILIDKLKALQRNALEDAETIARLTLERDMYLEKPAGFLAISKPKLSTSPISTGTQTETHKPSDLPKTPDHGKIPSVQNIEPPKEIRTALNRLQGSTTPLIDWQRENKEYTLSIAKGENLSITPEKRHIYRCWVAAALIQKWSNPESKNTKAMQEWMTGNDKGMRIPELSNNSCFQKGENYRAIYQWMQAHDILFEKAVEQVNALSPSPGRSPFLSRHNSKASSDHTEDRSLGSEFQSAGSTPKKEHIYHPHEELSDAEYSPQETEIFMEEAQ